MAPTQPSISVLRRLRNEDVGMVWWQDDRRINLSSTATFTATQRHQHTMKISTDFEAQNAIDEKIAHLETAIYSLKSQRNSFSAISHLPDDVLSLIFLECKDDAIEDAAWLNIIGICRRWRAVILSTPRFWSSITAYDLPFVDTMINRAKSLPLSLKLAVPQMMSDCARAGFDTILSNSSRVDYLSFQLLDTSEQCDSLLSFMSKIENREFPLLKTFKIASINAEDLAFSLPRSIWSPQTTFSTFRTLELSDVNFPLENVPLLASLTNLIVHHDYTDTGLSIPWITQFLRSTPNLEALELDAVESNGQVTVTGPFPVALPKLLKIKATLGTIDESALFDYLGVPATAWIHVTYRAHHSDKNKTIDTSTIERLVQKQIHAASIECLTLVFDKACLRIFLYSGDARLPTFTIFLPYRDSAPQCFTRFLALSFSRIPEVTVHTLPTTSPLIWSPFTDTPKTVWDGASSPTLTYLELTGPMLPPPDSLCLPSLTVLSVKGAPSINWTTRFLLNTPNVQDIWLFTISPDNPATTSFPVASLPNLEYIEFASVSMAESKLLDHLQFPASASVLAEFPNPHTGELIDLSSFERHYARLTAEGILAGDASISIDEINGRFELGLCHPTKEHMFIKLQLPLVTASMDAYVSLCSKLPLADIKNLRISDISSPSTALLWSTIIPSFINLTKLTLDDANYSLLDVLLSPNVTPNSPYCNAKLKTITDFDPSWDDEAMAKMKKLFKGRRDMGLAIEKYVLTGEAVRQDISDGLKEFVEVEWEAESLDLVRLAVDKEIAAENARHTTALSALHQRRNTLSPINRLPSDVLSAVFLCYIGNFCLVDDGFTDELPNGEWVNVLGVCKHWRDVLLETPHFWSSISLSERILPMASRMIKRSKTVPLTVYIPFFGNCPKGFVSPESFDLFWSAVDNLLTQKARLVDLQLRCDVKTGAELHKLLNMMEKHTFPALHTLRIDMDDFEAPLFNSSMNIHGPFPWESFPSLQSLELYDVLVPPNIPPLPSLRSLLVDCTSRRDGTVCFSVNWAVSFLQKTPNLEVLELNEITPYIPTPFPAPVSRVSLPNLLSLTVQGEEPSSAKIFDFIELPSHPIRVRFTSSTPEEDIGRSEDIIAPLATLCAGVASIHRDHGNPVSKIVMSARPSVSRFKVALFAPQETSSMVDLHIDGVSASHFFNLCSSSIPLNDVAEFVIEHNDTADRRIHTNTAAQQAIDQEIAEHEAAIRTLRQHRNAYAAISHLPDDILSMIFVTYKEELLYVTRRFGCFNNVLGVCSHWRRVITNTPQFWAIIAPTYFSLSTMLENSKQSMLRLYFPLYDMSVRDYETYDIPQVLSHADRIQELAFRFVDFDSSQVAQFIFDANSHYFPSLQVLKLEFESPSYFDLVEFPWSSATKLHTLELSNVIILSSPSPSIPTLKYLILCLPSDASLPWVISFLHHTPNLVDFDLDIPDGAEDLSDLALKSPTPVPLLRLNRMRLASKSPGAWQLFQHLKLSSSAKVIIELPSGLDCRSFDIVSLWRKRDLYVPKDVRRISFEVKAIEDCDNYISLSFHLPHGDVLHLEVAYPASRSSPSTCFESFVSLSSITDLSIHLRREDVSSWAFILRNFRDLKVLKIYGSDSEDLRILFQRIASDSDVEELERLYVVGTVWSDSDARLIATLLEYFPVAKITIQRSTITEKQVNILQERSEVEWDGTGIEAVL
ncbi:hypothetical protein ONZ45_g9396 [Pleurotus djamor]|nr:hypothetical protein ONZ45_g9396 [Pleurotus djamor]